MSKVQTRAMFGGKQKAAVNLWKFLSFHEILLSIMEAGDDYVEVHILLQKMQILQPQINALIIDRFC